MASNTTSETKKVKASKYTTKGLAVKDLALGMQSGSDRGCYVQWKFAKAKPSQIDATGRKKKAKGNQTASFEVDWEYWEGHRYPQTAAQKKGLLSTILTAHRRRENTTEAPGNTTLG